MINRSLNQVLSLGQKCGWTGNILVNNTRVRVAQSGGMGTAKVTNLKVVSETGAAVLVGVSIMVSWFFPARYYVN